MADKPTGIQALSIIALALGAMGFFGGAFNYVMLVLNPKPDAPVENNSKLEELNAEYVGKMEALEKEQRPLQKVLVPCMMAASLLLAAAGIGGLRLRGRAFLQVAFASSLVVDTIGAVYGIIIQNRTMELTRWYMKEVAATTKAPAGLDMIMTVSLYTGLFFGFGWLVAKTVIYLWGLIYFGKRSVREAFDGAPAPPDPI